MSTAPVRAAVSKPIRRLLIANRGEIARRVIRTAHRVGIETVAVFSDADANALHVREATAAYALGGNASADSYLRIDKLLAAAKATGADAVHPGYGFLSENADFAQAVADAGLAWVGPPAAAIRALGSKSGAKKIAQAQGIPCLPGYFGEDQADERFATEARRIGYPVMVKAAAGGGGRGMRLVTEEAGLAAALRSARSEAQASFGSAELLLERALFAPRHVEVQVFADAHGHCIHLGERDCSVQRRHQKLIEETPGPAVDAALRERMGKCAVDLAKAAGYVGAGTVEFLLECGEFFLMEMNTRLQVEHPVTEAVTGLDLVEWQLRVARGEPLPLQQEDVRFEGHAIEVRLCAEDAQFMPQAGTILRFREPPDCARAPSGLRGEGSVRFDHALFDGATVPPFYDSMLGKLVVHGATRAEAIGKLVAALKQTQVLGLATNRMLLVECLRHAEFAAGRAGIDFVARHGEEIRSLLQKQEQEIEHRRAVAAFSPLKNGHGRASTLPCPFPRPMRLEIGGRTHDIVVSGEPPSMAGDIAVVALADGRRHIQAGGVDLFVRDLSFEPKTGGAAAGSGAIELRAPFAGRVAAVHASAGASVERGTPLVVLESMKLEHSLSAVRHATVADVLVTQGQQVTAGQALIKYEAASSHPGAGRDPDRESHS